MDIRYLLPNTGGFHKANLHGHTAVSDGRWTPQQFKDEYKKRGYSVVAITDHNEYRYHKCLNNDDFVCLAAVEGNVNTPEDGPDKLSNRRGTYHFNFYDTAPEARPAGFRLPEISEEMYGDIESVNRWLGEIEDMGFLCCYNHPYWSLQDWRNYAGLKHLFAMEIYNHGCELDGMYGFAPQAYDEMLAAGQMLYPLATDDNHNVYPLESPLCDAFGGFIMLKMETLSYEATIEALKNGDFYASMGPEIHELYVDDGELVVKCSPVGKIYVKSAGRRCLSRVAAAGDTLTETRFTLEGFEGPFRVDIRDAGGLHACTRAYSI